MKHTTDGFELFMKDTNGVGAAFMSAIMKLAEVSAMDKKVHELAYISVLVTSKMYEGLPYHIVQASEYGATLEELKSAILLPMPIVGLQVVEALTYLEEKME